MLKLCNPARPGGVTTPVGVGPPKGKDGVNSAEDPREIVGSAIAAAQEETVPPRLSQARNWNVPMPPATVPGTLKAAVGAIKKPAVEDVVRNVADPTNAKFGLVSSTIPAAHRREPQ